MIQLQNEDKIMSASLPQLGSQNQEENSRKTFIFKKILNEARHRPDEIIEDFRECLFKKSFIFIKGKSGTGLYLCNL